LIQQSGARCIRLEPHNAKDFNEMLQRDLVELCEHIEDNHFVNGFKHPQMPDPRPELRDDSGRWIKLLRLTEDICDLYGVLHGFRCYGGRLSASGALEYDADLSGWRDLSEYEADYAKYIKPHEDTLQMLLKQIVVTTKNEQKAA
jgi:hypothetical protein